LKLLHALIRPHFFVPVHGEYKMLKKHAQLAEKLGMPARNIIIPDLGDMLELSTNGLKKIGSVPFGSRLIDGHGEGDIDSSVLRDRQALAEDGICIVGIGYNGKNGEIISGPDIMTKGLVYGNEIEKIITEAKAVVLGAVEKSPITDDINEARNQIRKDIQGYFNKSFNRRPIVVSMLEKF
jgi:ribonuclease J